MFHSPCERRSTRPQFRVKRTSLVTNVTKLFLTLSFFFGYFFSLQIGIPTFIFGLSLALLYKLTMLSKKFGPMFLLLLGMSFVFTIYSPIHEGIHLLFAHVSGAPISEVKWWLLTDSGIENPCVTIDFTSMSVQVVVASYMAPFLVLSFVFTTLWYIWYVRKSLWMFFACVPLSLNFVLSTVDLGLSQIVGLAISSIVFALLLFVSLCYSKV